MPMTLPLVPSKGSYNFDTTLQDGVTYLFRVQWVAVDNAWYMDIKTIEGDEIATAVKLNLGATIGPRLVNRVPGAPPGFFFVIDTSGQGKEAGYDDLGTRVVVKFFHIQELFFLFQIGGTIS